VHNRLDNLEHRECGDAVADERAEHAPALQLGEPLLGRPAALGRPRGCRGLRPLHKARLIARTFALLSLRSRGHRRFLVNALLPPAHGSNEDRPGGQRTQPSYRSKPSSCLFIESSPWHVGPPRANLGTLMLLVDMVGNAGLTD